jgi:hypothetical protein
VECNRIDAGAASCARVHLLDKVPISIMTLAANRKRHNCMAWLSYCEHSAKIKLSLRPLVITIINLFRNAFLHLVSCVCVAKFAVLNKNQA